MLLAVLKLDQYYSGVKSQSAGRQNLSLKGVSEEDRFVYNLLTAQRFVSL